MKILFITTWYPNKENPVTGVFVREHAKAVKLYNDVIVLHCAVNPLINKRFFKIEHENDQNLTEGIITYRVWRRRLPIPIISYFNFILAVIRGFQHIVSTGFRPDIMHAHIYEAGVPAILISKLYNIPVVITEHSTVFPRKLLSKIGILQAKFAFGLSNLVLPVSLSLQKAIQEYQIKAKYRVVPNVIDTNFFFPDTGITDKGKIKRLLFVGLLDSSHKKGIPFLLKALAMLREKYNDWQLDIVGDGPGRAEYERLANNLRIYEKVTFHGIKSKKEVAEFMRQADIFVLPSLWENLPCVLIEAMASGLPIVSTLIGGIPEIVDDEVGVLVPPGNIEKMSDAIAFMIEKNDEFNRIKIAQKAQTYSMKTVGKLITTIYKSCIE